MYKFLLILLFAYGLAVTNEIYDNSYALIIGIDKYKYADQLNYAVKDAEAVKDMLIDKFDYPEENIRYLIDEEATLSNIKLNLGEVAASAGENDRILVFFSGHGETLQNQDGNNAGYIIPYAGKQENPYATGLPMVDLLKAGQLSHAKHMLFLMDVCYGSTMAAVTEHVKGLPNPKEQNYFKKITNAKARQIITAGGWEEQVIERDEWGHSAFTKNLLAGLDDWEADTNNDGYVTADELGTYLRKSVTEDSDFQQTPQKGRFKNSGSGEFVFISETLENEVAQQQQMAQLTELLLAQAQDKQTPPVMKHKKPKRPDGTEGEEKSEKKNLIEKLTSLFKKKEKGNNERQKETELLEDATINSYHNLNEEELIKALGKQPPDEDIPIIAKELDKRRLTRLSKINNNILLSNNNKIYNDSWAVIIGINNYTKSKPLKYAVNDALAIHKMLIDKFGFNNDNIRLLIDNDATYSEIRTQLIEVARLSKENDRILVYFAGHGQTASTTDNMQIGYLIPVHGDLNKPLLDGIPMDEILRMCRFSESKHMLFLMDACYSGLMAEQKRGIQKSKNKENYISTVGNISARQIITAGGAEDEAMESDEWEHSVFAHNLLNALNNWEAAKNNSEFITASELGEYLRNSVSNDTMGKQTPEVARIRYSENGEFIFTRNP